MFTILILSGSLRPGSSTDAICRTLADVAPPGVHLRLADSLATLPYFDDSAEPPATVEGFRRAVQIADAVLIITPEYAFGVPGMLKNALDWTVGSGEFVHKLTGVITGATHGQHAHASLQLVLSALSARVSPDTTLLIAPVKSFIRQGSVIDETQRQRLRAVLLALQKTAA